MGKTIKDLTDDELTKRIADVESGLSDYEATFANDVRKQVKSGRTLSPRQRALAERIADEKT